MADQNSSLKSVSNRYASALLDLAEESKVVDVVERDLRQFQQLLDESKDLSRLIKSPVFSRDVKSEAIALILEKTTLHQNVKNFIRLVAKNARLFVLPVMINEFFSLLAIKRGEVTAEVTTAEKLTESNLSKLQDVLNSAIGKNVNIQATVDSNILGGLIVKVGSKMIDASLRTKLNSLKVVMRGVD